MSEVLEFRALVGDRKFSDLTWADVEEPLNYEVAEFLRRFVKHRAGQRIRVLDFGCGRGTLVGQLRRCGAEAYGVDIDRRFVKAGHILSEEGLSEGRTPGPDILSVLGAGGRSIFPDGFFDAIISDQVLEHVADLDQLAAETSRLLKPGGALFHRFPGRYILVEPHYFLPLVHWLPPRSKARWSMARLLLRLGLGVRLTVDLPVRKKAEVICTYADMHTFYRAPHAIAQAFARHGIELEFGTMFRWWLCRKLQSRFGLRGAMLRLAKFLLRSERLVFFLGDIYCWRLTGTRIGEAADGAHHGQDGTMEAAGRAVLPERHPRRF